MKQYEPFRLIMLRHGNTFHAHEKAVQVGCKTDLALTDKGVAQAHSFTQFLLEKKLKPTAIYAGSLQRQVQSAHILHEVFNDALLSTHELALNEIDYGLWEGLTSDAIDASWPREYAAWKNQSTWPNHVFQGTFDQHIKSLRKWLETVSNHAAKQELIIAISSNGIIRMMLQFIPTLWQKLVAEQKMEEYKVGTGNYCDLTIDNMMPNINAWNVKP